MRLSWNRFHSVFLLSAAVMAVSCRALESFDKVQKSTTEVGEKMDKTNDGIDRTNRKMDKTNGSIDETNEKMDDVRRQMSDMNNKLVETNKRMDTMNDALDRMYQDLRQGDSLNARLKTIENLLAARQLKGKTVFAAQYFMSFEYQLWKGEGFDGQQFRQVLMSVAVEEFVQTLRRLSRSDFPINVMDDNNDLASLEALAISMHMVNSNSALDLQSKNYSVESMHSLLTKALQFGNDLQQSKVASSNIPDYAKFALKEPELVRYLFELRVNMLPALIMNGISDVSSDEFFVRWMSRAKVFLRPWTARTESMNELQLTEFVRWISWANSDLAFLKSVGIKPRMDASMLKALKNMRLSESNSTGNESASSLARFRVLDSLKAELELFLSQTK